jgi:ATP/maltotriose-dependent transcriptional regulator MalT
VDTQAIHETRVLVLRAQLALLDGDTEGAADLARRVLARDPLNPHARTAASPNTPTPTPSLLKGAT